MNESADARGSDYRVWVEEIRMREAQGALFLAYDSAERALADPRFRDDLWLRHRAVLCLARAGATEAAYRAFSELRLEGERRDPEVAALRARLMKDRALRAPVEVRNELLSQSADAYESLFRSTGHYYPAVNAATLWALVGREEAARGLAEEALPLAERDRPSDELEQYYRLASIAECHIVRGNEDDATGALQEAAAYGRHGLAARSTTLRQLKRLIAHRGLAEATLEPLAPPPVIHYTGHLVAAPGEPGRLTESDVDSVRGAIRDELARLQPGFAYGGIASGADLLFVEELMSRGVEVTAILPFDLEEFVRTSVSQGGPAWIERFWHYQHRLEREGRLVFATDDSYQGDDTLFRYADEYAMGLAIMRARHIEAHVEQLTVWDGRASEAEGGTYASRIAWEATGKPQTNVAWRPSSTYDRDTAPGAPAVARDRRALLFGDFKGFSKLPDRLLPRFVEVALGTVKEVIDRHPVLSSKTWGDAIFLVLEDAAPAVRCALDLQRALESVDWEAQGFEVPLRLRLGGHYGPVYYATDPVLGERVYFGAHVNRAARVEPITPPGGVYVTEQFATKLSLSHGTDFECEYVGVKDAPKEYGRLPLSLVRPVA